MITPTGRRLLVEAIEPKTQTTKAGIVLSPQWNAAPESIQGLVKLAGPDCIIAKVGDIILVPQFSPTRAQEAPTDKTFIVPEEDVIGLITND